MKICKTCDLKEGEVLFKLERRECESCRTKKRLLKYSENKNKFLSKNTNWKRANNEKHQANLLNSRFKHRYGITIEEYNSMLKNQNGRCKICSTLETGRKLSARLSVDHCHKTGKVRGLLCFHCNSGLGKFKDNPKVLENAIQYLETTK